MKRAVIDEILRSLDSVTASDEGFSASEKAGLDLLAGSGSEVITIASIRGVRLHELYIEVRNEKGHRLFLEYERLVGVRARGESGGRTGRAGFGLS